MAPYLDRRSYAGVLAGLLPDDAEEQMLRLRHASPPTPPLEDQLHGLMDDMENMENQA